MARTAKLIDYRELTVVMLRKKTAALLLGLAVVSAIVTTAGYLVNTSVTRSAPAKQVANKQIKGEKSPKFPLTYTVKEGDTLAAISQKMYGSDAYVQNIMTANNLYTSDHLEAGKALTIPAITPVASQGQIGEGVMTGKVTFKGDTYTVQAGESLADIAIKVYGDVNAWVRIAQANNISDPNLINEGMVLKIPKN